MLLKHEHAARLRDQVRSAESTDRIRLDHVSLRSRVNCAKPKIQSSDALSRSGNCRGCNCRCSCISHMLCVCGHTPSTAYFSSNPSASKADSASRHSRQASNNLNTPQNYDFSCCGSRRISTVTSKPVFAALRVSCESQCLLHAQRSARTLSRRCQIHHNRLLCTSIAKSSRIAEQQIVFRSATSTEDLQQASVLRADAYYEVRSNCPRTTASMLHQRSQSCHTFAGTAPRSVCWQL